MADTVNDSDDRCLLRERVAMFAHKLVHRCVRTRADASLSSTSDSGVAGSSDPSASLCSTYRTCSDLDLIDDDADAAAVC